MGRGLASAAVAVALAAGAAGARAQSTEPALCPAGTAWVPAGDLWVGSPYGECPDESILPHEPVRVRAMCIDPSPVTVGAYERCAAQADCPPRANDARCATDAAAPADCVTWEGARRYCISRGTHLPTEAQLDRAIRALAAPGDDLREWTATRGDERRPWLPRGRGGGRDDRIARWGAHDLGSARAWRTAEPFLGFRCRAEAPADAPPTPLHGAWTAPRCFAHSHADDRYACLDFGLTADDMGSLDLGPMDFERWTPPSPRVAWGGHKSVVLVGPGSAQSLAISHRDYFSEDPIVHVRSAAAAVRLATTHGYRLPVSGTPPLANGHWTRFHHLWLRFESRYHAGDASEYWIGSLLLACEDPSTPGVATTPLLPRHRAETAQLFESPGASGFVVGTMMQGGGEGSWYFHTDYTFVAWDVCP